MRCVRVPQRRFSSAGSAGSGVRGAPSQDALVSLCKRRGFVFPSSEIYGGFQGALDYGPLGAALKKNLRDRWWRDFVARRPDVVPLDTSIMMNAQVWRAAGHVEHFTDPLTECATCRHRARADKLVEAKLGDGVAYDHSLEGLSAALRMNKVRCPSCGGADTLGPVRNFNLLFNVRVGAVEDATSSTYLRPETAQGMFVQFANVHRALRRRLPFGIAQIGKAFRNELSPGNFLFRTREFEQAELEYFCEEADAPALYAHWVDACHTWLLALGVQPGSVRRRVHERAELAHYAAATTDLEFKFAHGWGELWGIAHRGAHDLTQHSKVSGADLRCEGKGGARVMPHVVEPALGVDRLVYALLSDAYAVEAVPRPAHDEEPTRTVLRLHPALAPIKLSLLPLFKKAEFVALASRLHAAVLRRAPAELDVSGSIGRRYRRADEAGTPWCATVDHQSLADGTVTLRHRDTTAQHRIPAAQLPAFAARIGLDDDEAGDEGVKAA